MRASSWAAEYGLIDVVVGAGVEHPHDLGVVVTGGGDDHRHGRHAADHAEHVGAVEVRQARGRGRRRRAASRPRRRGRRRRGPRCGPRARRRRATRAMRLPDPLVVLDHEHRCHRAPTLRRRPRRGHRGSTRLNPPLGRPWAAAKRRAGQDGRVRQDRRSSSPRGSWPAPSPSTLASVGVSTVSDQVTGSSRPAPLSAEQVSDELARRRRRDASHRRRVDHDDDGAADHRRPPPPASTGGRPASASTTDLAPRGRWRPPTTTTTAPPPAAGRPGPTTSSAAPSPCASPPPGVTVVVATPARRASPWTISDSHGNGARVEFESDDHRSRRRRLVGRRSAGRGPRGRLSAGFTSP